MVVAARKSALRRPGASPKPKRSVVFGERPRTFCVTNSHYSAPPVSCAYANHRGGSKGPVLFPVHTEEALAKAARDAHEMAKECEQDSDSMGCVFLLHYKYRHNPHHLDAYYNPTCRETRREDETGDWREPPCDSDCDSDTAVFNFDADLDADLEAAIATIEPDPVG